MCDKKFPLISRGRKVRNIAPKNWGHQRGYGVEVIAPAARIFFLTKSLFRCFKVSYRQGVVLDLTRFCSK